MVTFYFLSLKKNKSQNDFINWCCLFIDYRDVFEGFENDSTEALDGSDSDIQSNLVPNKSGKLPTITNEPLNMGPYDGICLKTGKKDYWMKNRPDESALITNDQLFSYLGSQGPLKI